MKLGIALATCGLSMMPGLGIAQAEHPEMVVDACSIAAQRGRSQKGIRRASEGHRQPPPTCIDILILLGNTSNYRSSNDNVSWAAAAG